MMFPYKFYPHHHALIHYHPILLFDFQGKFFGANIQPNNQGLDVNYEEILHKIHLKENYFNLIRKQEGSSIQIFI